MCSPVTEPYLQVFGDGVCGAMRDHQDGEGLADHAMADLDEPCLPVCDPCPHGGQAQRRVIGMVQLSVKRTTVQRLSEIFVYIHIRTCLIIVFSVRMA